MDKFNFSLPEELIASYPNTNRDQSRLMVLNSQQIMHQKFNNIIDYMAPGDCLVLNNTKVIKARLFGNKKTGGAIELLIERIVNNHQLIAHIKKNGPLHKGTELLLPNDLSVIVTDNIEGLFHLTVKQDVDIYEYLENYGKIPLPPYMKRQGQDDDLERYQTVYAEHQGSVAAPTAGLHFSKELLQKITDKGIKVVYVTLHIGAGTFKPIKDLATHVMHKEQFVIPEQTVETILATKKLGKKVICVGTTSVRSIESSAKHNFSILSGDTNLFIQPGYQWSIPDRIITNFHLPQSSLLMLVSAFAGYDNIMKAYQTAIAEKYRFFSYGDSMLLFPEQ